MIEFTHLHTAKHVLGVASWHKWQSDKSDKTEFLDAQLLKFENAGDQVIVTHLHMLRGEFLF